MHPQSGAVVMRGDHLNRVIAGRVTTLVFRRGVRNKNISPTLLPESVTQINIFEVHEETVVEPTHRIEGGAP